MKIQKLDNINSECRAKLYIIDNKDKIDSIGLSVDELGFVKKQIDDNKKSIVIQKLSEYLFIELLDDFKKIDASEAARRRAVGVYNTVNKNKICCICISDITDNSHIVKGFLEGLLSVSYRFIKYIKSADDKKNHVDNINISSKNISETEIAEIYNTYTSVYECRDLVNEPVSHLNAIQFAERVEEISKEAGFSYQKLSKEDIEKHGMGGLLGVNKGSIVPPTFSILTWKPDNAVNEKPVVLVGKGVVFDTGGLNLKVPAGSIDDMKSDMGGAATVVGIMAAVSRNKLPLYVIALTPTTDNRPGGDAIAPGDILHMHNGSTVEILNTDAEGRLILADALSYAKQYNPQLVVSMATLTGNAWIITGDNATIIMGNADRKHFSSLNESGDSTFERMVELPFWDEYGELIKSDIADIKNLGPREGGAITAGKFLEHFTDYPYIHMDIAGTAFVKKANTYRPSGGTGVGVRLMYDFLKKMV